MLSIAKPQRISPALRLVSLCACLITFCFALSCDRGAPNAIDAADPKPARIPDNILGDVDTTSTLISANSENFLIAYGISNYARDVDYCLIDRTGLLQSCIDTGPDGWFLAFHRLAPSGLQALEQLIKSAGLTGLANEYHANIADGTQQYLAFTSGKGIRVIYFNNEYPESAGPLLAFLHALIKKAAPAGSEKKISQTEAHANSPFKKFY